MRQIAAIVLREMIIFQRRFWRYLFSFSISPLLYLVAFGWAGRHRMEVDSVAYAHFLLPGLIAMSSMINSFSLAMEINVARFYWHTFDEIRSAPISDFAYVTGEAISGMARGLFSALIVTTLGIVFDVPIPMKACLLLTVILNTFVFSSLAVSAAMLAKKHADQSLISNFVITPMAFLCGTFFPVEYYPSSVQTMISFLPLTHASLAIRASFSGAPVPAFSMVYLVLFGAFAFYLAVRVVRLSKN